MRFMGDLISTAISAVQLTLAASVVVVILATVPGIAPVPVTNVLHALAGIWTLILAFVPAVLGPIAG